jgi:hypothetical protein
MKDLCIDANKSLIRLIIFTTSTSGYRIGSFKPPFAAVPVAWVNKTSKSVPLGSINFHENL